MLRIERSRTDTLCLFGELDLTAYEALRAELQGMSGPVRLDVSGVTFMDSTGLHVILERVKTGPVTLAFPTSPVVRLLELCGLTDLDGLQVELPARSN